MVLVAGVDSSTSACKVEIRDADTGKHWASGRWPHPRADPPRSEQDPAAWWAALIQAWHDAARYDVAALSVAAQQHGLVVLDEEARVLRPAKLWNDTESAPDAAALVVSKTGDEWADACGSVPVAAFTIAKLAWLRRVEPEVFRRVHHVLLPHDWLTWRLTGRMVTDRGDASGTGYWSPREGRWRVDLLDVVDAATDWSAVLPVVLAPSEAAGSLDNDAALPLGLDGREVVIGAGTGDNMAAALGAGLKPGDVCMSLGTSGTIMAVAQRAPAGDGSGTVAGFADATGRWLPLVCTMNATRVTTTIAHILGMSDDGFAAAALSAPAGAGGLTCLPWFDGERTPNRPDATGTFVGLTNDAGPAAIARAAVEGVVCGLLHGLDAIVAATDMAPQRIVLVGGGARSAAYRRAVADLSGLAVETLDPQIEPVALGACVQAAAALEGSPPDDVAAAWRLDRHREITDPNPRVDREAIRHRWARAAGL